MHSSDFVYPSLGYLLDFGSQILGFSLFRHLYHGFESLQESLDAATLQCKGTGEFRNSLTGQLKKVHPLLYVSVYVIQLPRLRSGMLYIIKFKTR